MLLFKLVFSIVGAFDSRLGKERKVTRIGVEAAGVFEGRLAIKQITLKPQGKTPTEVPSVVPSARAAKIVASMLKGGMIDRGQANRLLVRWHALTEEDFSHPELRAIREHTRAVLVSMAADDRQER